MFLVLGVQKSKWHGIFVQFIKKLQKVNDAGRHQGCVGLQLLTLLQNSILLAQYVCLDRQAEPQLVSLLPSPYCMQSFWVPSETPEAETKVEKPDTETYCPAT
eukprot:917332-Pelagomonas_calceolata.AAC.1